MTHISSSQRRFLEATTFFPSHIYFDFLRLALYKVVGSYPSSPYGIGEEMNHRLTEDERERVYTVAADLAEALARRQDTNNTPTNQSTNHDQS